MSIAPALRLLPLSVCIALALPAWAADEPKDDNWGLCPLEDVVPRFSDAAGAKGESDQRVQQPTDIEGDTLQGEQAADTVVQGNVKLTRGDQFLGTDKLSLNQETGQYVAEGSVRYQDSGMRIVAQRAEGNQEKDSHTISDLRYQLTERRGNGGAERIELHGDDGALIGSTYSTCAPSQRAWELRASRIDVNTKKGIGVAHNATLRIGKVPVLYVPWFMFPTDDRRRTGLLYPVISMNGRNGFDWKQPIYLNLAPNYDATLLPRLMSNRGGLIGGQFRWLYENGRGQIDGTWMPSDQLPGDESWRYLNDLNNKPIPGATLPDKNRGQFSLGATHNLGSKWYAASNLGWVSDTHYIEDFSNSLYGVSSYLLRSTVGLYGRGRNWSAGLAADHNQLTDYTLSEANLPFNRQPRAYVRWAQPFARWFEAGVDAEAVRFTHSDIKNVMIEEEPPANVDVPGGTRFDLKPYISMPLEGASWFLNPKLAWRHTSYQLNGDARSRAREYIRHSTGAIVNPDTIDPLVIERFRDDAPTRSLPITSLDAGLFFDRHTEILGDNYLHTFEPRLFYLRVPYENQDAIPLFDTAPMTFSWGQLFRDNRYTGADRQIDTNQLTTAVSTRFIEEASGRERLALSFGQIRYFKDSRVTVPGEVPLERGKSAWVAEAGFAPSDRWTINAAYQWDPKFRREDLASLRARYLLGDQGIINLGYRYRRDLVEQADFSFMYPVSQNWSVVGRYYYSLLDKKELETIAGVQWESCCLAVRVLGRRYLRNRSGELNNSIQVEFELKGLGSAGQDTRRVLRRAILGYDRDDLYLVPPSSVERNNGGRTDPSSDPTP